MSITFNSKWLYNKDTGELSIELIDGIFNEEGPTFEIWMDNSSILLEQSNNNLDLDYDFKIIEQDPRYKLLGGLNVVELSTDKKKVFIKSRWRNSFRLKTIGLNDYDVIYIRVYNGNNSTNNLLYLTNNQDLPIITNGFAKGSTLLTDSVPNNGINGYKPTIGPLINTHPWSIARILASKLLEKPPEQRLDMLRVPTVIEGLIDNWVLNSCIPIDNILNKHFILAARTMQGYTLAQSQGRLRDGMLSGSTLVKNRMNEFSIIMDDRQMIEQEDALLTEMVQTYPTPDMLKSVSACRLLSYGNRDNGVEMSCHDVAWLGMVSGSKMWYLGHPRPKPWSFGEVGIRTYILKPGEVMFLPDMWWHATINLGKEPVIAIGGQCRGIEENSLLTSVEKNGYGSKQNYEKHKPTRNQGYYLPPQNRHQQI